MAIGKFEVPEEWRDSLAELRERVRELPEDEEDRWIREGQARYDAMTPEERAKYDQGIQEELDRFQEPGVVEATHEVFRRGFEQS